MASLAVQPVLQPEPAESVVDAPRRAPDASARQGATGQETKDRVTLSAAARERSVSGKELDAAEQAEVAQLRADDQRVRTHERAHQAAGGGAAGAASFQYVTGPDGKQYAVAGEVPIRIEGGRSPDETIAAAQRMRAAALAPADPSAQDLAVAAEAVRMEMNARAQKARQASTVTSAPTARRAAAAYTQYGAAGTAFGAGAASTVAVRA